MTDPASGMATGTIAADDAGPVERTFLIADVRGYTRFTHERGDAEAARLALRFAELARDAVAARSGRVIELRGDEALGMFESSAQAVRAATELVAACAEEVEGDPTLPLLVGVGIDVGEAAPVEDGFRGAALNTAARLCSRATAGQVLVTARLAERAGEIEGVRFAPAGTAELKGFEQSVELIEVLAEERARPSVPEAGGEPLPLELEPNGPMLGREHEFSWLRGTWRQVRRGYGRVVFVSGPAQTGKTRLAAELAAFARSDNAAVTYAGAGGTAAALAVSALREAVADQRPTLLVLDDLDVTGEAVAPTLAELFEAIQAASTLVVGLVRDPDSIPLVARLIERADRTGDGHRGLGPLDAEGVRAIARLYAGDDVEEVPLESIGRASGAIPGRAHELMSEWAEQEATRRLAAAAEFLATEGRTRTADLEFANNVIGLKLARLYGDDRTAADTSHGDCPYKGLASFEESDARLFFGRERLVGELAARTVGFGLLAVVGASGSGKSSVIAAGLLPSLRAGLLPGSERWSSVVMRPGEHPMAELQSVMARDDGTERFVLVVDQFEEVFTACQDEDERSRFVDSLASTAADPEQAVVVIGLRGDYYGHCGTYPELARLLAANQVLVGPMSAEELRRAIELPARRAAIRVESALAEALVTEIDDEPGGLPLLSTALVELWVARSDGWLRLEAHERLGGVRGAVTRLADSSYENLVKDQRVAARRLFLRLVTSGEEGAVARRRVPLSELDLERDPVLASVVERVTQDRLLTAHGDAVEVAHEALLREWPRFQEWLTEDAQGRELREHLTQSAKRWETTGREAGELYRGARLSATLDWAAGRQQELNELEREFLAESGAESESELARQRRVNRRLKGLLVGVGVLLVLAVLAGVLALVARGNAKHSATGALAQRLGAQALVVKDIDLSLLLARQGVAIDDSQQTLANLESALVRSPAAIRVSRPLPGRLLGVGASDDGRLVGYSNNAGQLAFVDSQSGQVVRIVKGDGWGFGPRGSNEVVVGRGRPDGIHLFRVNLSTGAEKPYAALRKGPDDFFSISDDNRIWALRPASSGEVTVRETKTGRVLHRLRPAAGAPPFFDVNFRGRYLVVSSLKGPPGPFTPARSDIWRLKPWRLVATVDDPRGGFPFAVDPAGRRFVDGHRDGSVTVWDLRRGASRDLNGRHNAAVQGVGFSPDGKTIVSTGDDAQVLVWDADSGDLRQTLEGHTGRALGPAFSPHGKTLYTVGLDGAAITWDLEGSRLLGRPFQAGKGNEVPEDEGDPAPTFAVSPDGRRLAVTQASGRVAVVEVASGRRVFETPSVGGRVLNIAWRPDGRELATAAERGQVATWSANDGTSIRLSFPGISAKLPPAATEPRLATPTNDVFAIAYSPDGRILAASAADGRILRWDARSGQQIGKSLSAGKAAIGNVALGLAFSPDGEKLAAAFAILGDEGGVAVVWRLSDGQELYRANIDDGYGRGSTVAFSPDGRLLATGGGSGEIKLWDAESGKQDGRTLTGTAGWVLSLDFDQAGRLLVSSGTDGSTRIWDVERRAPFGSPLPGLDNIWANSRLTPSGDRLAVVYSTGTGFVWQMTPSSWEQHACDVAGRTLTKREWELYLPGRRYTTVCPELGAAD